jgi:tripartite-type tricarboxylate transporter receptor subunit TctC
VIDRGTFWHKLRTQRRTSKFMPTVAEVLPGFRANGWFTLMAPASTPDAIVQQISQDLRRVLDRPGVKERFEALQTYPRPMSAAETAAFIRDQQQLWRPFVKEVGAAPQ